MNTEQHLKVLNDLVLEYTEDQRLQAENEICNYCDSNDLQSEDFYLVFEFEAFVVVYRRILDLVTVDKLLAQGVDIHWCNPHHKVVKSKFGEYLIKCTNGTFHYMYKEEGELNIDMRDLYVVDYPMCD